MRRKLLGAVLYLLSLTPFPLLYILSDLLFLLLYYLIGYRRKVVETNIRNAFPSKNNAERKKIEIDFYRFFTDLILESVKMRTISQQEIKSRFRFRNPEVMTDLLGKGGVIAATGHYANWEWGTLIITATINEPVLVVFKPLTDKPFEDLLNAMRSRFGAIMVSMKSTLRKLVTYKGKSFLMVLVSDQTPPAHETQYFTTFLNQTTAVFLGVEKIARLTNHPVVFCHIDRTGRGRYECTYKLLTGDPSLTSEHEITELHTRELESIINKRPELWLWSHRRWKFAPKAEKND